jgi:hypothetical protein
MLSATESLWVVTSSVLTRLIDMGGSAVVDGLGSGCEWITEERAPTTKGCYHPSDNANRSPGGSRP